MSVTKATSKTSTIKKIWVSTPLVTLNVTDPAVVNFLENSRKDLEVQTAAFITQYLMDNNVPFAVDFDSTKLEKESVLRSIPRRLQRMLGFKSVKAVATSESNDSEELTSDNDPMLASLPL